jgi:hypothetical protein
MINDIYLMFLVAHDDGMRLSYVLRPQMGLLFIPKMIYEYRESPSEMILTGKNQRSWGENLSQCYCVLHKSHMDLHSYKPRPPP